MKAAKQFFLLFILAASISSLHAQPSILQWQHQFDTKQVQRNFQACSHWEDAANWSCGIVPDINTDVIINAGPGNAPEVNSNASCRSITIRSNATILVKSGFNLTIKN